MDLITRKSKNEIQVYHKLPDNSLFPFATCSDESTAYVVASAFHMLALVRSLDSKLLNSEQRKLKELSLAIADGKMLLVQTLE